MKNSETKTFAVYFGRTCRGAGVGCSSKKYARGVDSKAWSKTAECGVLSQTIGERSPVSVHGGGLFVSPNKRMGIWCWCFGRCWCCFPRAALKDFEVRLKAAPTPTNVQFDRIKQARWTVAIYYVYTTIINRCILELLELSGPLYIYIICLLFCGHLCLSCGSMD